MTNANVTLVFNHTPLWILCGVGVIAFLLSVVVRVKEWLEDTEAERRREKEYRAVSLDAAPRMEAMGLMEKLGNVRTQMLELDRALTQRREGVPWKFGIGANADNAFRDADEGSDVDQFLSRATKRDLNDAQGEMISLFRDTAKWLEKYAPEEKPPPSVLQKAVSALRTFAGRFFLMLNRNADAKMIPVVRKAQEKHLSDNSEPPEKVTDAEAAAGPAKSREKLRIPLDFLEAGKPENPADAASLREEARRLTDTLRTYKIDAVLSGMPVAGPSVTRYEFRLQPGVKLSKLVNLSDDIALSMGVGGVRIAPVPGKNSVVGIETPNRKTSSVLLRDVLESRDFVYGPPTTFALGRAIDGEIVTGDIAELPHVLIAGTTNSGKSVCLNVIIVSLLYKAAPEELRFLMIDPKQVELTPYNGVPHLSQPVVTNPAQAVAALHKAVIEMDTRHKAFMGCGVKGLSEYNRKTKSALPRMVIVIDELSDLIMTSDREVEDSVKRIAQMGRAAGIHLVIATQRPSADVVTGLIKANIPSRIAFAVTSATESRIILDRPGAEKLVGNGDMFYAPQVGEQKRVQGCYVSSEEIEKVTSFLKTK